MKVTKKQEKELLEKIRKIKKLEAETKEINKEIDEIKGEIKAFMEKKDVTEIEVDIFKVRYAEIESMKFDTESFRKTHEELYEQYRKPQITKRFTII